MTQDYLKSILSYDPKTGIFVWLVNKARSKTHGVGTVAGCRNKAGYMIVKINRKIYYQHRLAWLYVTGSDSLCEIDHIDGVRHNNTFQNLREATVAQQQYNRSDIQGHWYEGGKWRARLRSNGVDINLGSHPTKSEARAAYLAGCKKYQDEKFLNRKKGEYESTR